MLQLSELHRQMEQVTENLELFHAVDGHNALKDEYCERLKRAEAALQRASAFDRSMMGSKKLEFSIIDLMDCRFNLNRCIAISELVLNGNPFPDRFERSFIVEPTKDRILTRWWIAGLSRVRRHVLRYPDSYQVPPLNQSLRLMLVERMVSKPRILAWMSKLRRMISR